MSYPADDSRTDQAHRLVLELQSLRRRLNDTIDQLCDLAAGQELLGGPVGLSPLVSQDDQAIERNFAPAWLRVPADAASVTQPISGHRLGPETAVYTDVRSGFLQFIQVGQPRGADERYAMVVNHADFDGTFLSLVLDARALLADMPSGTARVALAVEVRASGASGLSAKCAWKVGEQWSERTLRVQSGQLSADSFVIDAFDPSQVEAFDFHVFFNPNGRGSFEIKRLMASIIVSPPTEASPVSSVFETAP